MKVDICLLKVKKKENTSWSEGWVHCEENGIFSSFSMFQGLTLGKLQLLYWWYRIFLFVLQGGRRIVRVFIHSVFCHFLLHHIFKNSDRDQGVRQQQHWFILSTILHKQTNPQTSLLKKMIIHVVVQITHLSKRYTNLHFYRINQQKYFKAVFKQQD